MIRGQPRFSRLNQRHLDPDRRVRGTEPMAGRPIQCARYYGRLPADAHLTRPLFGVMVRRIAALPVAPG